LLPHQAAKAGWTRLRRITAPTLLRPMINMAQVVGSGTPGVPLVKYSFASELEP
jgi:hypothetical protein